MTSSSSSSSSGIGYYAAFQDAIDDEIDAANRKITPIRDFVRGRQDWWNVSGPDTFPSVPCLAGECCICLSSRGHSKASKINDVYLCNGWVLCGDCRYKVRTGKEARHEPLRKRTITEPSSDNRYGGGFGSNTLNRFRTEQCRSEKHAAILLDLIRCGQ